MPSPRTWFKKRWSTKSRAPQTTPTPPVQPQPASPTSPTQSQPTPTTPLPSPQPPSQTRSILPNDPSKLDHSLGTLSTALAILKGVAEITPVPGLKGAADIALTLVETIRSTRANISGSADLAYHTAYLIKELCESCPESPGQRLQAAIDDFTSELKDIGDKMKELSSKNRSKALATSKTDADSIKSFRDSLNMAHKRFMMSLNLNMIHLTSNIERRLETGMEQHPGSSLPSLNMPPKPEIFFGREDYVNQVVDVIINKPNARVAILGPGGMGKTSIALTVMQNPRITNTFKEDHCHWVPCEKATSPEFLVGLLAKSTDVPKSSNDLLKDVVQTLKVSNHRHIFLLDNLETLMDIEGKRAESDAIITAIALPNVNILVTMRGALPPSTDFQWTSPSLQTLSPKAARQTFITIYPGSSSDHQLDKLLHALDYVPLAVKLMAVVGSLGESPTMLLERWKEERTPLLHQAEDHLNSVDHSIRLSLQSSPIRSNPEAVQLLAILSMLPGGAQRHLLTKVAPSIKGLNASLSILLRVSLAYKRTDNDVIHVLSPIRSYMLHHHQLDPRIRQDIYKTYYAMAERGDCMGKPEYVDAVRELSKEEANLEAVLLDALEYGDGREAVIASLEYSRYLYGTTPRIAVITGATATAKKLEYHELYANCVMYRGKIHQMQERYDEAQADFQAARAQFERIEDRHGIAHCLQSLGGIHRMQNRYDEAQASLQAAREQFERIEDQQGAAQCLRNLGNIHRMQSRYNEAQADLQAARDQFERIEDRLGAAWCLMGLGEIHRIQNRYDEAQANLQAAQHQFELVEDRQGVARCLLTLGDIHRMQDRYDEAQTNFQAARDQFKQLENQRGEAQCLLNSGEIHRMQNRYDEARADFQAARDQFKRIEDLQGEAWCLQCLGAIHHMQNRYDEAQANLQAAQHQFERLENRLGAAQCLLRLGEIYRMQDQYDEAQANLQAARDQFERIEDQRGVARCLRSLGDLHYTQGRYDEAQPNLQAARDQFERLEDRQGVAQCLQSLGDIHLMQNRYDEAQANLQAARDQFEQLENQLGTAQCLRSLGEIYCMQNRYGEAQANVQAARDRFERIEDQLGIAQCLQSLGDIHRMQNRYDEAQTNLQEARGQFELVGNRRGAAQCLKSLELILQQRRDVNATPSL